MFVRTKSTPNSPRKSVQIVESVRDGTRVKQKIVRHVGIAMNEDELKELLKLAEHIKHEIENEHTPTLFGAEKMATLSIQEREARQNDEDHIPVNLSKLREEQRVVVGIHDIFGKMYKELGWLAEEPMWWDHSI